MHRSLFPALLALASVLFLSGCAGGGSLTGGPNVRSQLLPPNVHGRLVNRRMSPKYITVHATENRGGTAAMHGNFLSNKGKRSKNNPRFGRSGWVTWHYSVDDREAVQHLLPSEQGDHADYGGPGDRSSIGIEICEFRERGRQAASIDRAARLTASLANRYGIPNSRIVPHMNWPRWDFKNGKPCPRILLERDSRSPGGWKKGARWNEFIAQVQRYR